MAVYLQLIADVGKNEIDTIYTRILQIWEMLHNLRELYLIGSVLSIV